MRFGFLLVCAVLASCGSDEGDETPGGGGAGSGAGGGAGAGSGGKLGSSGGAGSGSGGSAGSAAGSAGRASGGSGGAEAGAPSTGGADGPCTDANDCGGGRCCTTGVGEPSCVGIAEDCMGLILCSRSAECRDGEVCCPQGFCGGCD